MTQVETFELTESGPDSCELEPAAVAKRDQLLEELSLDGQKKLGDGGNTMRYPAMSKLQLFVYGTLYPERTGFREFEIERIPTRVLEVAKEAWDSGVFKELEVWHPEDSAAVVDPVLVGVMQPRQYTTRRYILARWGDALEDFQVLTAKAIGVAKARVKSKLVEIREKVEAKIRTFEQAAGADELAELAGETGQISIPSYYDH